MWGRAVTQVQIKSRQLRARHTGRRLKAESSIRIAAIDERRECAERIANSEARVTRHLRSLIPGADGIRSPLTRYSLTVFNVVASATLIGRFLLESHP
jgi:hypothetical protein